MVLTPSQQWEWELNEAELLAGKPTGEAFIESLTSKNPNALRAIEKGDYHLRSSDEQDLSFPQWIEKHISLIFFWKTKMNDRKNIAVTQEWKEVEYTHLYTNELPYKSLNTEFLWYWFYIRSEENTRKVVDSTGEKVSFFLSELAETPRKREWWEDKWALFASPLRIQTNWDWLKWLLDDSLDPEKPKSGVIYIDRAEK